MTQRKSLSSADSGIDLYRQAIGELKRRAEYELWVTVHRQLAIHNSSNYFLAWHRAYLYFFEKRLQELVSGATIPYWDWTRLREIPRDFRGTGNPLNHPRNPGVIVPTLPSVQSIEGPNGLLSLQNYSSFASQLEDAPHNRVHNWVGADMANISVSPRDPLFWCHHSHVDHLWDRWQRENTFDGPADPNRRLDIGSGRVITVREVLRISNLGYEYVLTTVNLRIAESVAGVPGSPARHLVPTSGYELETIAAAEFRLEGIPLPRHHPYEIRVFFNQPDATPETPTDDNPHFVGYFDAVVMGHDHHARGAVSSGEVMSDTMTVSLDITQAFRAALRPPSGAESEGRLARMIITLVPVGDAQEFRFEQAAIVLQE